MDLLEAIRMRHSVRSYTDARIEGETLDELTALIDECNRESGLNIQLCLSEPEAFSGLMARYGKFRNVKNYIALIGAPNDDMDEKCGYYGERLVLRAQQLGLKTCWVGANYSKGKIAAEVGPGEKCRVVIALGYGASPGAAHKSKPLEALGGPLEAAPDWFIAGLEAAQLAPTAMNQQKFRFELEGNAVRLSTASGFYVKVDQGIARYHFEIGAGDAEWAWA